MSAVTSTISTPKAEFSRLDLAFAQFFSNRSNLNSASEQEQLFKLLAKLSAAQNNGHSCIKINKLEIQLVIQSQLATITNKESNLHSIIQPLVLELNYLYTHKYWFYETRLALQLKKLLAQPVTNTINTDDATANCVLKHKFSIITGGPGTGKTTSVVKILAKLQEATQQQPQEFLSIALAAPTGKAAMRLQESIGNNLQELNCTPIIKAQIQTNVSTIHRLLGAKYHSAFFKHHANKPLPYDLVVIDEASMVDLALMSKLVDALKPAARLILLGDKDQLSSVESGSVLADLTYNSPTYTIELKKSYRFQGLIKELATAINTQQGQQAWQLLNQNDADIGLLTTDLISYIANKQQSYLNLVRQRDTCKNIFAAFNEFQVLCATRHGENSVNAINSQVEQQLNLTNTWYVGRPIMIQENNPNLELYNGDIGICMHCKHSNELMVYFLQADGNSIKTFLPSRLPPCSTVFAMTIHKSQGSEFNEVLILLPTKNMPILTKELIYTAITRAKTKLNLVAEKSVFISAIAQKVQRQSNLHLKMQL